MTAAMTDRHEVELKYVLPDAPMLERLARELGAEPSQAVLQRNHFFDTASLTLRQHKLVLRLRLEGSEYFLTAKGPTVGEKGQHLSRKAEAEISLARPRARAILEGQLDPLTCLERSPAKDECPGLLLALREALGPDVLKSVGSFENLRLRVPWAPDDSGRMLTLEFDATTFPGNQREYEVELEIPADVAPEPVQTMLEAWLGKHGVVPKTAPGKAKRFFQALVKLGPPSP